MKLTVLRNPGMATLIALAACQGQTVAAGWNDEGTTPNQASISAKCSETNGSPVSTPDLSTFVGQLAGRWYRCGDADPAIGFAPPAIELTSDLKWYVLVADASGTVVRSTAPEDSGVFQTDKVISACCPDSYAVSFDGDIHVDIAGFESSPTRMTWSYDGPAARTVGARYVQ